MKIKITRNFNAYGSAFEGIIKGQIYEVLSIDGDDVWIQGNGEPVKLLGPESDSFQTEYKFID